MKKRIFIGISVLMLLALTLCMISCGSKGDANEDYITPGYAENGSSGPADSIVSNPDTSGDGSKIIKTATVTAETQKYTESTEALKTLITTVGGHISNSNMSENSSYRNDGKKEKYANYTIKVPAEQFDTFISGLSSIFNVTNMSTVTEDVSESYFTLQARIETLQAKREGLVSMLKNVDVNTDFATWKQINSELTEIDTQINIYNDQLKSLENKVSYATVTLSVREVAEYTETEEKGYGAEVLDALKGSGSAVVEFFKGLLIAIIYVLPFAMIFGGSVVIIIVIIRTSIRRKRAKRNKHNADDN